MASPHGGQRQITTVCVFHKRCGVEQSVMYGKTGFLMTAPQQKLKNSSHAYLKGRTMSVIAVSPLQECPSLICRWTLVKL